MLQQLGKLVQLVGYTGAWPAKITNMWRARANIFVARSTKPKWRLFRSPIYQEFKIDRAEILWIVLAKGIYYISTVDPIIGRYRLSCENMEWENRADLMYTYGSASKIIIQYSTLHKYKAQIAMMGTTVSHLWDYHRLDSVPHPIRSNTENYTVKLWLYSTVYSYAAYGASPHRLSPTAYR